MKIGDRIFVRGYIDEIRKDTVIVRNDGGYFGTVLSEVTGELPSAQPNQNAEPGKMVEDCISRQAAIDALMVAINDVGILDGDDIRAVFDNLPSAQPTQEIIHCKDCKHWNLQVGNVKGDGLGSCDFHNVNLVTGEGFCYWAEKRGEAE